MSGAIRASGATMPSGVTQIVDSAYVRIPVELIDPNPHQPRQFFDRRALEALAASVLQIGQLEDVLVRPKEGRFQLVLGERRWRAHQIAHIPTINAKVRELSDADVFTISLTENVQREDLTKIEEGLAFKNYIDSGMTQEMVGEHLGKLHSRVSEKLSVLSSSFYIRYLEQEMGRMQHDMAQLQERTAELSSRMVTVCIDPDELDAMLRRGCEFVAQLHDGRCVVKRIAQGTEGDDISAV